jgi:hypothetical protein
MKRFVMLFAVVFALTPLVARSAAGSLALPKDHAEWMKNEFYKESFERFAALVKEAEEKLGAEEYAAVERANEKAAKDTEEESNSGPDEWGMAWNLRADDIGQVIAWDWLHKNAKGAQGYYALKDEFQDGYLTVRENDDGSGYAVTIFAIQKYEPQNSGEITGEGKLDGNKMTVDFGSEDPAATVTVTFDGETANVETSEAFHGSGWLGLNVYIDGEYAREKK